MIEVKELKQEKNASQKASKRMLKILEETEIYSGENKHLMNELIAYEVGIEIIEKEIETLLQDVFIQTASREVLQAKELLFRPYVSETELNKLRETLRLRYSVRELDATEKHLTEIITAAGGTGVAKEKQNGGILIDISDLNLPKEEFMLEMDTFLPAHLGCEYVFDILNWKYLDLVSKTFDELDGYDFTWDELNG